ncbi:MAG: bifunctional (p)ppGpp synthetase/guanosine-3',5'-bis(diphosphate) 3'-pyrophosphohydrolase [Magnetococcales bacterium]|nr:bifunctional (p)ppGpp synthetase/guanosine-3',5'-bis(diphosphate) 3'-pyrophosphohydrolase [Magnetococcales bacterium]
MTRWNEVIDRILSYHADADVDLLERLQVFVDKLPKGKGRACLNVPLHPLSVVSILVDLRLDTSSIASGLLVDSLASKVVSLEQIRQEFGDDIANLAEGIVRIFGLPKPSSSEIQAEEFRKMLLAMAQDVRVVLVRLALCLQQVREASSYSEQDSRALAKEILDIYAPIAHRLGIHWIKNELEERCFQLSEPEVYSNLRSRLLARRKGGKDVVQKVIDFLVENLKLHGVIGRVYGREKNLYSIHGKLKRRQTEDMDTLYDLIAYRIIVEEKADCYRALGMVHSELRPIPGCFKDYIALPKGNGYQSLHTVVWGPFGNRIEIQIRTERMHEVAESGVAAHWVYKDKGLSSRKKNDTSGYAWLQQLLALHQSADDPTKFIENAKIDLFPDEIYVFTPQGKIITLPRNATPVDFAYAVHSAVGDSCRGARINERMVPLKTPLNTGDTVEILRGKQRSPNPNWQRFVVTSKAKQRIARWVKQQQRDQMIDLGRELLDRESVKSGSRYAVTEDQLHTLAREMGLADQYEVWFQIGVSELSAIHVLNKIYPDLLTRNTSKGKRIRQHGGRRSRSFAEMAMRTAKCCSPVPGDVAVGVISTGRGITLHRSSCTNLVGLDRKRWIEDIPWPDGEGIVYPVRIQAMVYEQKRVLTEITQAFHDAQSDLISHRRQDKERDPCVFMLEAEVKDLAHLQVVLNRLRQVPGVVGVGRSRG